jgi:NAD(P)-dependent dehydrogenase (short-subunit alcohol dehydrogenase family)
MTVLSAPASGAGFDLSGRVALVTGAARGLGRHFARVLAQAGAKVALTGRDPQALDTAAGQIGDGAVGIGGLDVTDPASVGPAFDAAEAALGPVDILVNNAGLLIAKPLLEQTPEDWRRVVATDLDGAWYVAQEAARRMAGRGGGAIVNVSSISGVRAGDWVPSYAAAKAGLNHLTRAMAMELAPAGVRVNALAPGYMATEMSAAFFNSDRGRQALARVPMARPGRFTELDGALLLLAGDAGAYITGVVLPVDGGALVSVL